MKTDVTGDNRPIIILDSGIGGLTVLREVRFKLPFERLIYVIDDAGFPYGRWDETPLTDRLIQIVGQQIALHRRPGVGYRES